MNAFLSATLLIGAAVLSSGLPTREKRAISYPYETCIAKISSQFQAEGTDPLLNWDDENVLTFDEERRLNTAPMSYACFRQCYFEEGKRAGPDGLPSSAAYKRISDEEKSASTDPMSESNWFGDLSQSLAICEGQLKDKTIRNITLTDIEKAPAGVDQVKCKSALLLDSCMYRHTVLAKFTDEEVIETMFRDIQLVHKVNSPSANDIEDSAELEPFPLDPHPLPGDALIGEHDEHDDEHDEHDEHDDEPDEHDGEHDHEDDEPKGDAPGAPEAGEPAPSSDPVDTPPE